MWCDKPDSKEAEGVRCLRGGVNEMVHGGGRKWYRSSLQSCKMTLSLWTDQWQSQVRWHTCRWVGLALTVPHGGLPVIHIISPGHVNCLYFNVFASCSASFLISCIVQQAMLCISEPIKFAFFKHYNMYCNNATHFVSIDNYSTTNKFRFFKHYNDSPTTFDHNLVLSNIRMIGLNLPCTNILIMVVSQTFCPWTCACLNLVIGYTLWSLMCDEQLIGCIWHHPQLKIVYIYHIIIANTQDMFLNNISFSKGAIHSA